VIHVVLHGLVFPDGTASPVGSFPICPVNVSDRSQSLFPFDLGVRRTVFRFNLNYGVPTPRSLFCSAKLDRANFFFFTRAFRRRLHCDISISGVRKRVPLGFQGDFVPRVCAHFHFDVFTHRGSVVDWNLTFSEPQSIDVRFGAKFFASARWEEVPAPIELDFAKVSRLCFAVFLFLELRRLRVKISWGKLRPTIVSAWMVSFSSAFGFPTLGVLVGVGLATAHVNLNDSGVMSVAGLCILFASPVYGFFLGLFCRMFGKQPVTFFAASLISLYLMCSLKYAEVLTVRPIADPVWPLLSLYLVSALHFAGARVGLCLSERLALAPLQTARVDRRWLQSTLPIRLRPLMVNFWEFMLCSLVLMPTVWTIQTMKLGLDLALPVITCVLCLAVVDIRVAAARKAFGNYEVNDVIVRIMMVAAAVLGDAAVIGMQRPSLDEVDWGLRVVIWALVLGVGIGGVSFTIVFLMLLKRSGQRITADEMRVE
jgi:hypothetical protein